jgi:hypothetical protein
MELPRGAQGNLTKEEMDGSKPIDVQLGHHGETRDARVRALMDEIDESVVFWELVYDNLSSLQKVLIFQGFQYVDTTVSENGLTKHPHPTKMIARRAKHLLAL